MTTNTKHVMLTVSAASLLAGVLMALPAFGDDTVPKAPIRPIMKSPPLHSVIQAPKWDEASLSVKPIEMRLTRPVVDGYALFAIKFPLSVEGMQKIGLRPVNSSKLVADGTVFNGEVYRGYSVARNGSVDEAEMNKHVGAMFKLRFKRQFHGAAEIVEAIAQ
jgi:hypothetical protein